MLTTYIYIISMNILEHFVFSFKNVSKTQLKCSWLNHPKSAPPKETTDLDGLYPRNEYRYDTYMILI